MSPRSLPARFAIPLLALLLCALGPAGAAEPPAGAPATDAQIDRLVEVMHLKSQMDAMLPAIEASQKQMVDKMASTQRLSPAQRAVMDRLAAKSILRIREALTWEHLAPIYHDVYRKTFSSGDMEAMIGFYGSPAGQRVLEKMPRLMQETLSAMQSLVLPMMDQLQADIREEIEAAQASQADGGPGTAAPSPDAPSPAN